MSRTARSDHRYPRGTPTVPAFALSRYSSREPPKHRLPTSPQTVSNDSPFEDSGTALLLRLGLELSRAAPRACQRAIPPRPSPTHVWRCVRVRVFYITPHIYGAARAPTHCLPSNRVRASQIFFPELYRGTEAECRFWDIGPRALGRPEATGHSMGQAQGSCPFVKTCN